MNPYRGRKHINHGGNIDGFCSYISFIPEENIGVVILSNLENPFCTLPIAYSIYGKLLGYDYFDWSEKTKNEATKMFKGTENNNEAVSKISKENPTSSHLLEEYEELYKNPGYGTVEIKRKDNDLKLTYNNIKYKLSHKCYDIFTMIMMMSNEITIAFNYNNNRAINSISIPFEQSVQDIVFKKIYVVF